MSRLLVVRHGQASFGAADYDVLSERGIEQSRRFGRYLAERGEAIHAVFTGPRRRQIDTARHARDGFALPEPTILDELDEYPAFEIVAHCAPRLRETDPALRRLTDEASPQSMGQVFDYVLRKWIDDDLDVGALERYPQFLARVRRAVEKIAEHERAQSERGRRVLVFTSGGPISLLMKMALGLDDVRAFTLQTIIANTSLTELRLRERELHLRTFNTLPHLSPDLVTHR